MTDREREAEEALERVRRDAETVGSSSMARLGRRVGGHFAATDAVGEGESGTTDPIELWGRRIGRLLSIIGFVLLSLWLAFQLDLL